MLNRRGLALEGDTLLVDTRRRALLISRTARGPVPATEWVRRTVEAVRYSVQNDETLVCGIGRTAFDVALAACRRARGRAVVLLQEPPNRTWRDQWGDLLPARYLLAWPTSGAPSAVPIQARNVPWRDAMMAELADRAWAVQVRPSGNMAAVLERLRERGCAVDNAPIGHHDEPPPPAAQPPCVPSPMDTVRLAGGPYLTHYTREPEGRWPDETPAEYADWLAHGPLDARRDALDSLVRILTTRRVLPSGRLMPKGRSMVSLTAREPGEMGALTRWHRGLRRWTFRPYGLAVPRDALRAKGARPVRYLSRREREILSPEDQYFTQGHDPPRTDWSGEAEWRLPGELSLDDAIWREIRALVPAQAEAEAIGARFQVQTLAVGE